MSTLQRLFAYVPPSLKSKVEKEARDVSKKVGYHVSESAIINAALVKYFE